MNKNKNEHNDNKKKKIRNNQKLFLLYFCTHTCFLNFLPIWCTVAHFAVSLLRVQRHCFGKMEKEKKTWKNYRICWTEHILFLL
uniref:Uncharacterized protein n=1 Tax=Anguilla anguilla TaxID=7936 RepID=A0A0E9R3U4_ANGAN